MTNRKTFIFICIIFVVGFTANIINSTNSYYNYIFPKRASLEHHELTQKKLIADSALLLGSSNIAGNLFPENSTLADYLNVNSKTYYFNLGYIEGTILDSLIFLKKSLKYVKPKVVIVGMGPEMLTRNLGTENIAQNELMLRNMLSKKTNEEIESENKTKLFNPIVLDFITNSFFPFKWSLKIKSELFRLNDALYGSRFEKHVEITDLRSIAAVKYGEEWHEVLDAFIILCKKEKIKAVFYLEPNLDFENYYSKLDYEIYLSRLVKYFEMNKIAYFNYTNIVPKNSNYFVDFVHLKPKGYEYLASQLSYDLNKDVP